MAILTARVAIASQKATKNSTDLDNLEATLTGAIETTGIMVTTAGRTVLTEATVMVAMVAATAATVGAMVVAMVEAAGVAETGLPLPHLALRRGKCHQ